VNREISCFLASFLQPTAKLLNARPIKKKVLQQPRFEFVAHEEFPKTMSAQDIRKVSEFCLRLVLFEVE
jgi:hypothetical protein